MSINIDQSEWTSKPVLHIFPHWNWAAGQEVDVWAYYNNADEVELFLNGKSLGKKSQTKRRFAYFLARKIRTGNAESHFQKRGKVVLEKEIHTAGQSFQN